MLDIEFIVIGNELLNGRILDSNTHWLARALAQRCLCLYQVTIVPDDETDLREAIERAWKRSHVVVTSGGLGPTEDDITKSVLAQTFDKEIQFSDRAIEVVTQNYNNFERIPQFTHNGYAHIPEDFEPLPNPVGLAPGLYYQEEDKFILAAPGVPFEFRHMLEEEFFPRLSKLKKTDGFKQELITIRTRGIPEEILFYELCSDLWEELSQFGMVSSLPTPLGVDIVVSLQYKSEDELREVKEKVKEAVYSTPIKEAIWHIGREPLEEVIIEKARKKRLTIATAESCTGGLVASTLANVSGCSDVFKGSMVCYWNEIKSSALQVKKKTLTNYGAVSEEVACEMVEGVKKATGAQLCVSTTGIAGPLGGSEKKPVGTLCVGISSERTTFAQTHKFRGDRDILRTRFTSMALYLLLEEIEQV